MKILISEREILPRLYGSPTDYITTGKNAVRYAIDNCDFIKFYYDYLSPEKFLYGQVRYSASHKDYYIEFNDFKSINNSKECDPIYFKDLKYTLVNDARKVIISINIDKCFRLPVEEYSNLYQYMYDKNTYSDCLKLLQQSREKFYNRIIELYKSGDIELLNHEIQEDNFSLSDPTLKINIEYRSTGQDIWTVITYSLNRILTDIETFFKNNTVEPNCSFDGYIPMMNSRYKDINIYVTYNAMPKNELFVILEQAK